MDRAMVIEDCHSHTRSPFCVNAANRTLYPGACTPRKAPSTLAFATQVLCAMTYQSFDQEYSPSPISYSISGVHIE